MINIDSLELFAQLVAVHNAYVVEKIALVGQATTLASGARASSCFQIRAALA